MLYSSGKAGTNRTQAIDPELNSSKEILVKGKAANVLFAANKLHITACF